MAHTPSDLHVLSVEVTHDTADAPSPFSGSVNTQKREGRPCPNSVALTTQTIFPPYLLLQLIPRRKLQLQPLLRLLETLPEELVLHLSTVEAHLPLVHCSRESERPVRKLGERAVPSRPQPFVHNFTVLTEFPRFNPRLRIWKSHIKSKLKTPLSPGSLP